MTRHRLDHRPTTLTGGPLHGHTARIYRNHGGHEPPTITLCLGLNLPHLEPTGYATYQRDPAGDYTWTGTP